MICIYALVDPRDESVRYVGQSKHVFRRLKEHLANEPGDPVFKAQWIAELRAAGYTPILRFLEDCDESDADAVEKRWIAVHSGPLLFNGKYPQPRSRAGRTRAPGGGGNFVRVPDDLNLAAVARGTNVYRPRRMKPCGVCGKLVALWPGSQTRVWAHKFKDVRCSGGKWPGGPRAPRNLVTDHAMTRQIEYKTSPDKHLALTDRQKVAARRKVSREREADAWLAAVKARKKAT